MIPASLRLSWATSSLERRGLAGLVAGVAAFTFGITATAAAGSSNPRVVFWCTGVVVAALVGIDFPGTGHARWSEFELSLPVPPRERARARLLLSLAAWLLPLPIGLVIGRFVAGPQFSVAAAASALASASACIVLAVALRHTLGLHTSGLGTGVLRSLMIAIVLAGFVLPFAPVGTSALLLALPLFAIAHRQAARTPEMRVASDAVEHPVAEYDLPGALEPRAADPANQETASKREASGPTTLEQIALRYSVRSGYALTMLLMALLWAFGVTSGWGLSGAAHVLFLMLWVMNHTLWSTRLLRLGHLPYPRARLFKFVAWPPLVAVAIGASLGVALPPSDSLARIEAKNGGVTLKSQDRAFRFTTGEPPLVTAPNGESHQPEARTFGLGSALVAYDPYETPPTASHTFLVHQLGRLLAEERGISLEPMQIEQRFLAGFNGHRRLDDDRYPELRYALGPTERVVTAVTLMLAALLVMFTIVQPGAARDPNGWQRGSAAWIFLSVFLLAQLLQLTVIAAKTGVNPVAVAIAGTLRPLAQYALLSVPAAIALGVSLYRSLLQRFARMEPPLRAKVYDSWFVEI